MEYEIVGLVFTGVVALIASLVLLFLIEAIFLWVGAKVAAIENASFGRAFASAIVIAIMVPILTAIVASLLPNGGLIGLIVGILAIIWIIKSIFNTGWAKAFVAWVMSIVGFVIATFIVAIIFASATFL